MPRDLIAARQLVDRIAAVTGRFRIPSLGAAVLGRQRATAAVADHDQLLAAGRGAIRMLRYLLAVLCVLAVYTGLLAFTSPLVANWVITGVTAVVAITVELRRRTRAQTVPVHAGFADDPDELEQQLAELRPPDPVSEIAAAYDEIHRWLDNTATDIRLQMDRIADDVRVSGDALHVWLDERAARARRAVAAVAAYIPSAVDGQHEHRENGSVGGDEGSAAAPRSAGAAGAGAPADGGDRGDRRAQATR